MAKRKINKPKVCCNVEACDITDKPRRSIPISEVEEIIKREVNRVEAARTIYDDRLAILNQLEDNESYLGSLQARLHHAQIQNKQIRNDLARVNLAITRQMELDGE